MSGEVERAEDLGTKESDICKRWLRELKLADTREKTWRERAKKIVDIYRNEKAAAENKSDDAPNKFNVLYSNTEVLKGVMYQRTPVPDCRRRFIDKDPIARQAAQILQRAISYSNDCDETDAALRACVEDVLLPGRAVARVSYKPTLDKIDAPDGTDTKQIDRVVYQEVTTDYVEWDMFRMSPAKRWEKVRWVAFGELLTRDELTAQFGDKGTRCTLHWKPDDVQESSEDGDLFKRALVWAVWDKTKREIVIVSEGFKESPLKVVPDPLGLEGFFPIKRPVYSVSTTSSMVPVPEYVQYQDQARELDEITERIEKLVASLKRRGLYDATYKELGQLGKAGDDEFIAVENFANLAAKGGIEAALYEMPLETIGKVLLGLYQQRDQIKATIYEITGIADIVRGSTNPNETLGAQQIKARYANVRTQPRQQLIEKFARDLFRMKAEIIAEKFEPDILKMMTGPEMWMIEGQDATEKIMQLLRNEKLRGFRVDVETGSTVEPDGNEEQQNRVELLTAMTAFITGIAPAVQGGQIPMDFAVQLMSWGLRAFKVGPQLEEAIDALGQQGGQQQNVAMLKQQLMQYQQREEELKQREQEVSAHDLERQKHTDDVRLREQQQQDDVDLKVREQDMKQEVATMQPADGKKQSGPRVPLTPTAEAAQGQQQILETLQAVAQGLAQMGQALQAIHQLAATAAAPKMLQRMPDGTKVAVPMPPAMH